MFPTLLLIKSWKVGMRCQFHYRSFVYDIY